MAGKIIVAVCLVVAFICVTAEAYTCPQVPMAKCIRQGDVKCSADKPCAKGSYCCPTICNGAECKTPEVTCPYYTQVACFAKDPNLCDTEANDCAAGSKCCGTQCGGTACYSGDQ